MEEKTLIESESYSGKKVFSIILIICICLVAIGLLMHASNFDGCREHDGYWGHRHYSIIDNMFDPFSFLPGLLIDIGLILGIVFALITWKISSYKMTVTDMRIFGKTSFGRRVDLPLDSISAIGTSVFKGIAVATSSGKIKFAFIKNRDEIHKVISDLLIERQNSSIKQAAKPAFQPVPNSFANIPAVAVNGTVNGTEEIKKYKELLDNGIITQEEFDAKKKQLLGL